MGVTRLLPLGPFYTIKTNFMYFFEHNCIIFCLFQFLLHFSSLFIKSMQFFKCIIQNSWQKLLFSQNLKFFKISQWKFFFSCKFKYVPIMYEWGKVKKKHYFWFWGKVVLRKIHVNHEENCVLVKEFLLHSRQKLLPLRK